MNRKKLITPRQFVICMGLVILIGWPLVGAITDLYLRVFGMAFLYAALALSWNLVALSGQISLGHAAFFGLGAYGAALANQYWSLTPVVTIFIGAGIAAAFGILWTIIFNNLRGASFALASLAAVEIPKVIISNWDSLTFGSLGVVGIQSLPDLTVGSLAIPFAESILAQYYLLLVMMLAVGVIHFRAIASRWGWAIRAVREQEIAAASLGVNVAGIRAQVLVISAFLTGLYGGLYAHLMGLIEPTLVFSLHISALPLILTIFGGRYTPYGPMLGALLLYPMDQLVFHPWLPSGHAILYGMTIILAIIFFPRGIATWFRQIQRNA